MNEDIENKLTELHDRGLLPAELVNQIKPPSFHGIVTNEDCSSDSTKLNAKLLNRLIKRHTKWGSQTGGSHLHLMIASELYQLLNLLK